MGLGWCSIQKVVCYFKIQQWGIHFGLVLFYINTFYDHLKDCNLNTKCMSTFGMILNGWNVNNRNQRQPYNTVPIPSHMRHTERNTHTCVWVFVHITQIRYASGLVHTTALESISLIKFKQCKCESGCLEDDSWYMLYHQGKDYIVVLIFIILWVVSRGISGYSNEQMQSVNIIVKMCRMPNHWTLDIWDTETQAVIAQHSNHRCVCGSVLPYAYIVRR